jgi:hypothetical protein
MNACKGCVEVAHAEKLVCPIKDCKRKLVAEHKVNFLANEAISEVKGRNIHTVVSENIFKDRLKIGMLPEKMIVEFIWPFYFKDINAKFIKT